jgi:glycosyltransferase involved in cell wall biosynthesis
VPQRLPIPIAFVLNSFNAGGTEHQMTELICRLDRRLFEVHVACLSGRGVLRARLEAASINPTEFPLRSLKSVDAFRQLRRLARWFQDRRVRVVHTCDFYANVFGLPAATIARVPVRIGSRRDVTIPERSQGQWLLQRLCYQLAHRVIANSSAAAGRLIEEGVHPRKVLTIANGLDAERFAIPKRESAPGGARIVTTVANLRPGKGHDVLLRAAARLVRRVPDIRFRIVGEGPRRRDLERQAAALRISSHVDFLGHRGDVPDLLRSSNVFVLPSFMEASPNALIEAMAAGVPIVATRVGGIPEAIEHDRSGILVPPGDDRALAAGIARLMKRPQIAARLAEAARQTAASRFSFDRMVREFQQLYFDELAARVEPEALTWAASSGN